MTKLTFAICALVVILALTGSAKADDYAFGFTEVTYDVPNNLVRGYHRTEISYGTGAYYKAWVCGELNVGGVTQTRGCWRGGTTGSTGHTQISGLPALVEGISDHNLDVYYINQSTSGYMDNFGFSFLPQSNEEHSDLYWPPLIYTEIFIDAVSLGSTWTQKATDCQEECAPCKSQRHNRKIVCGTVATACELGAFAAYEAGIQNCDNQSYCNPSNPNYNQTDCENCKNSQQTILLAATGGCGATATGCFLSLPDCNFKRDCTAGPPGTYSCKN